MTAIHLAAPGPADVGALLAFELDNRAFFESTIHARAEDLRSVRVLLGNGFVQFGHSRRSFELKGVRYDRLQFERRALTSTS